MRAGDLRHVCDVMRPAETKNTRGQERGKDTPIVRDWPCLITPFGSSESEIAGGSFANATFEIAGYSDPSMRFREKDYLLLKDGSGRRFDISGIVDTDQNGLNLVLTCGERVA